MYCDDRIKKMGLTVKDLFNLMHIDYSEIEWLCGCRIHLRDMRYSARILDQFNIASSPSYLLGGTYDVDITPIQLLKLPVEHTELTYDKSGSWIYMTAFVDLEDYCDYKYPREYHFNKRQRKHINAK